MRSPALSATSPVSRSSQDDTISSRHRPSRRIPSRIPLRLGLRNFTGVSTIIVGKAGRKPQSEITYAVHDELLSRASPFFAAALEGSFVEGTDRIVRLPDEKPEIFEWFLQWLYTGTLQTPSQQPCQLIKAASGGILDRSNEEPKNVTLTPKYAAAVLALQKEWEGGGGGGINSYSGQLTDGDLRNAQSSPKYYLLIELHGLSDRLLTTQLNNEICSTVVRLSEQTNSVPTPSDTWMLYDTIRDSAPLRTLILDLFIYKKTDRLLGTHPEDWHPQFLRDMCVRLKRPGTEAISRHSLVAWRPKTWAETRACEICRENFVPVNWPFPRPSGDGGVVTSVEVAPGEACWHCGKVFCASCLQSFGTDSARGIPSDTSGCRPWGGRGLCERYHDHTHEGLKRGEGGDGGCA